MDYIIETNQLTKKFGSKIAVDKVSLHIKKGDIYGFIGKNGAGKTTAMRLILGLAYPNSGTISLFGSNDLNTQRKKIGSLIETPSFYSNATAYENLKRFSILYNSKEEEIESILDFVGLKDVMKSKKVGQFSLGMKQRLGIALALLGNPEVLILDEPVNGLDPAGIKEVRDLILNLNTQKGVTFLISSHLLDELAKIANVFGIINNGVLVEELEADKLMQTFNKTLKIKVSDVDKTLTLLKKASLLGSYKIEGGYLHLGNVEKGPEINSLLIKSGIEVYEMSISKAGFEDYFIEKIGG